MFGQNDQKDRNVHKDADVPVVDVASRVDVPALDGIPHFFHDVCPHGLLHGPDLRPVEHDVWQDAAGVVGHLDAVRFTVQQVTASGDAGVRHSHSKHRDNDAQKNAVTPENRDELFGQQLRPQRLHFGHVTQQPQHVTVQLLLIRKLLRESRNQTVREERVIPVCLKRPYTVHTVKQWSTGHKRPQTHLQTLQEEIHAFTLQKHLTVIRRLVCDVPERTPRELHHLITLNTHTHTHVNSNSNQKNLFSLPELNLLGHNLKK